jgi:hypothetical protein
MGNPEIYIICTVSDSGRYVDRADTNRAGMEARAARMVEAAAADGWALDHLQEIPDAEQLEPVTPGVPYVCAVYHLRHPRRGWRNVELYRVPANV